MRTKWNKACRAPHLEPDTWGLCRSSYVIKPRERATHYRWCHVLRNQSGCCHDRPNHGRFTEFADTSVLVAIVGFFPENIILLTCPRANLSLLGNDYMGPNLMSTSTCRNWILSLFFKILKLRLFTLILSKINLRNLGGWGPSSPTARSGINEALKVLKEATGWECSLGLQAARPHFFF